MGKIKKTLFTQELPSRELHNSRMFVDLSENIHIHFRELRLMFSVEEFFEFFSILKAGTKDIKEYLKKIRKNSVSEILGDDLFFCYSSSAYTS